MIKLSINNNGHILVYDESTYITIFFLYTDKYIYNMTLNNYCNFSMVSSKNYNALNDNVHFFKPQSTDVYCIETTTFFKT